MDVQQQVIQLVQAAMQGDQQANQQIQQIMQAAQQGNQQAVQIAQMIQQVVQQMQGGQKAKQGAKLQYLRSLKNICNANEELVYMKKGGKVCPVCQKKKVEKECGGGAVAAFKAKCGAKAKRKMKDGGVTPKKTTPTTYDAKKHDKLKKEFQQAKKDANNNPKGWSSAKLDSLQAYNRMTPTDTVYQKKK